MEQLVLSLCTAPRVGLSLAALCFPGDTSKRHHPVMDAMLSGIRWSDCGGVGSVAGFLAIRGGRISVT